MNTAASFSVNQGGSQKVLVRRVVIRVLLVCAWLLLGVYLFITYRAHTMLLDNKGIPEKAISPLSRIRIQIDNQKPIELAPNERDKVMVVGRTHRIIVTEAGQTSPLVEKTISLAIGPDIYLLSVPALVAGSEEALTPFVQEIVRPKEEETPPSESTPF
ncbi:MAG: DUF6672 family protein [Breznakiellaceae bacterium]